MIYYDNRSWLALVFHHSGAAWKSAWPLVSFVVLVSSLCYFFEMQTGSVLGSVGHTTFGSTMCYLLVFRANTASERFWNGRTALTKLFLHMRELVMLMCLTMQGGVANKAWRERREQVEPDAEDLRASMARVNCVRWALALVVATKLHTRIAVDGYIKGRITAWQKRLVNLDRIRLRGLMTRKEFEDLNALVPIFNEPHVTKGAAFLTRHLVNEAVAEPEQDWYEVDTTPDLRQPLAVLMQLRMDICSQMGEDYAFKERFAKEMIELCNKVCLNFETIDVIITTPLPFPYAHLCKALLACFLACTPLVIDSSLGIFANVVIPAIVAMSLLSIEAIASELENPFGDDPNDLDVTGLVCQLERECMHILELCGDMRARRAFQHYDIPDQLCLLDDERTPYKFICLRSQMHTEAKVKLPPRASEQQKAGSGRRAEPNEGGDDDPRTPLLLPDKLNASLQTGFMPMKSLGSETVIFESEEAVARNAAVVDNVGLSDEEEDPLTPKLISPAPREKGQVKSKESMAEKPSGSHSLEEGEIPKSPEAARSGQRVGGGRSSGPSAGTTGAGFEEGAVPAAARQSSGRLRPGGGSARAGAMGSSASGFAPLSEEVRGSEHPRFSPLEEMGTQTIAFEETARADEQALDAVGLTDSEGEGEGEGEEGAGGVEAGKDPGRGSAASSSSGSSEDDESTSDVGPLYSPGSRMRMPPGGAMSSGSFLAKE